MQDRLRRSGTAALVLGLGALVAGCSGSSSSGGAASGTQAAAPAPSRPVAAQQSAPSAPTATGSGGSSSAAPAATTGQLKILIHDQPTPQVSEVWVELDLVEVESLTDGWQTVSTATRTIDLLALQGGVVAELGLTTLPAGDYGQIRLRVVDSWVITPAGRRPLNVPSGSTSGVKIVEGFQVPAGGRLTLTLDWDVGAHLHHNKGKGWILRPTIFVESAVVTNPCLDITFADPNLEAAVREKINVPTGPITDADVAGLTFLDASKRGITDLAGIECLTDLQTLRLAENQIHDVRPLAGLSLTQLWIHTNQITDLSPINVSAMSWLWADRNQISRLPSLAGSPIHTFQANTNQITDLSFAIGATQLRTLHVGANQVSNLNPIADLTGLTSLYCYENRISDLSPLAGMALTRLWCQINQITSLAPINMSQMSWLYADRNQITQVPSLAGSPISICFLNQNLLTDLSFATGALQITQLQFAVNQISDLSPIAGLTSLILVYCHFNQITDVAPLSGLTLTRLFCNRNMISDLSPVDMSGMDVLNASDNQISLGPDFSNAPVRIADLTNNRLTDISTAAGAANLQRLRVAFNQIPCPDPTIDLLRSRGVVVQSDCP